MKILVDDKEEAVIVSRFLVSLCNDIRMWSVDDEIKQREVETALMVMRDSIEVKE